MNDKEKPILQAKPGGRFTLMLLALIASTTVLTLSSELFVEIKIITLTMLWSGLLIFFHSKNHTALVLNSFIIYWFFIAAEKLSYGNIPSESLLTYFLGILGITLVFLLTYQEGGKKSKKLASLAVISASLIIYSLPLVQLVFHLSFQNSITTDIRYAIAQTNFREALEFLNIFIETKWLVLALSIISLSSYFLYQNGEKQIGRVKPLWALLIALIALQLTVINRADLRVVNAWRHEIQNYAVELSNFKKTQLKYRSNQINFQAKKEGAGETYVVIIGESLNKNHMSLYGYGRKTTPYLNSLLKKNEIIKLNNAYSIHTHTMQVLSLALTEANHQNNKSIQESPSIIDVANKAGFETHWITNQVLFGPWDNLVTVMAKNSDLVTALNRNVGKSTRTNHLDEEILKHIQSTLNQRSKNKNKLLFVHLIGNHAPYCSRFSHNFKKYDRSLDIKTFGALAKSSKLQSDINCYDNSVSYNDFVVSSIINLVKQQDGVSGVAYFSDHADDVFEKRGHNSAKFSFSMTEIPFLFWFSEQYKSRYKHKITRLNRNTNQLFPNDLSYDSLIGMLDIKTTNYNPSYDILSEMFGSTSIKHTTLHGKQPYFDGNNINYWQRQNISSLININQENRVIPHRVNSVGKLKDILNDGFHAFETDLIFRNNTGTYFEVGHDEETVSGMPLEEHLSSLPKGASSKIWLDIKNINKANLGPVLNRLLYLDKKYNLRRRAIIESDLTDSSFSKIAEAGFHTSFYLPTQALSKLMRSKDETAINKYALNISRQAIEQKVTAVSFDIKHYIFVKKYLEKYLKSPLDYHVWDLSIPINNDNFISELTSKGYFSDKKIKTLLVPYASLFDL